jgi:SAM-dependent methyltransferase
VSRRDELANHLIDATARRPRGLIAAFPYLSGRGAPRSHEASFDLLLDRVGSVEGEHVLDVGCGGGALISRLLAAGAFRVHGLDHSPHMLRAARRHNTVAHEMGRLTLVEGDAHELKWHDGAFTVLTAVNLFFFLERPQAALAEWFRVLRPGGRLAIATRPGPLPQLSPRNWWVAVWGRAMRVYSDDALAGMLEAAGFTSVSVETIPGLQLALAARPGLREAGL